ncbi:hypothetical protein EJB05_44437, partial [Eragrostis curvula]
HGHSTVDAGNNNNRPTISKANFPPYGRDFDGGIATGRFSNGRLVTDFLSEFLGLPPNVPAYLDTSYTIDQLATGVTFASGGSGLDNLTAAIMPLHLQFPIFSLANPPASLAKYREPAPLAIASSRTLPPVSRAPIAIPAPCLVQHAPFSALGRRALIAIAIPAGRSRRRRHCRRGGGGDSPRGRRRARGTRRRWSHRLPACARRLFSAPVRSWPSSEDDGGRGEAAAALLLNKIKLISSVRHIGLVLLLGCFLDRGEQILLNDDLRPKLADFGLSRASTTAYSYDDPIRSKGSKTPPRDEEDDPSRLVAMARYAAVVATLLLFLHLARADATALLLPMLSRVTTGRCARRIGGAVRALVNAAGVLGSFATRRYDRDATCGVSGALIVLCQVRYPTTILV